MNAASSKSGLFLGLGLLAAAVLLGQQALAAGTRAGTDVSNTALVDYEVGGVTQQQLSASADFVVDRRVDFTLSVTDANLTSVVPGGPPAGDPDYFVEFTLTNTSNGVLDFSLALAQIAAGNSFGGNPDTDSVDFTTVDYAVSADIVSGTNPDPVRGGPQFVDELEADESIRIRVFGDPQLGLANGDIAGVAITAQGAEPGGAGVEGGVLVDGTDDPAAIDNVFADLDGDNSETAEDGFEVVTADLAVTKSFSVISGDLGSGLPIPGAVVEYTITVVNSSTTTAADPVTISDAIDTDVTFVADGYDTGGGSQDVRIDNGGTVTLCSADASDGDADGCELTGGSIIVGGDDSVALAAGATLTVSFQVQIPDPATTP